MTDHSARCQHVSEPGARAVVLLAIARNAAARRSPDYGPLTGALAQVIRTCHDRPVRVEHGFGWSAAAGRQVACPSSRL